MRILHTADWHVGKTLRGRSRIDEHREVLAEIAAIARHERVDLVLVVGDLFDTAAPGADAEDVVYRALLDLAATGAAVIVLAGNHDNPKRLEAHASLFDLGHIVTRATFTSAEHGGLVEGTTRGGEAWRVAAVPFLSQRFVVHAADLLDSDGDVHANRYSARMQRIIGALTSGFDAGAVNLVAAHLHSAGGLLGGGERTAQTIFDYAVSPLCFPVAAHYVALGHLHRAQVVPGPCPIRYSGSPLQLDFGEVDDAKSVTLIDAHVGVPAVVREIALAGGRRLETVRGSLVELAAIAASRSSVVRSGGAAAYAAPWLKVVVRERPRLGLADEVRAMLPDALDVVVDDPTGPRPATPPRRSSAAEGRSPHELFGAYLDESQREVDPRVMQLFDRLLDEVTA